MRRYTNASSVSTTWEWRKVKIQPAARPPATTARAKRDAEGFAQDWRRRHTLQVAYRGGPEAWWELSDGRTKLRVPGSVCLHDVMRMLAGDLIPEG